MNSSNTHFSRCRRIQVAIDVGRNENGFYYVMELADPAMDPNSEERNQNAQISASENSGSASRASIEIPDSAVASDFAIRDPVEYVPHTLRHDLKTHGRLPVTEVIELGLSLAQALEHLHGQGLVHRDIKPSNIVFVRGKPKLADICGISQLLSVTVPSKSTLQRYDQWWPQSYAEGIGVQRDPKRALELYAQAAEMGDRAAERCLEELKAKHPWFSGK